MTAREYLSQAYRLDQRINNKLQQIEQLRSLAEKVRTSYGGERVSHTRNVTSMEDTLIRLMEAEIEINRQIDELVNLKIQIRKLIDKVHNVSYRLILEKRYLCFLPWDQIAVDMHYSRRWTLTKHERAIKVIEQILPEECAMSE